MRFYSTTLNGIVAVISAEHARIFLEVQREESASGILDVEHEAIRRGARIFTFCDPDRYERTQYADPYARLLYTGTYQDLELLIAAGGHELVGNPDDGWSAHVPNARRGELIGDSPDTLNRDLIYATSLTDVRQVFGVQFAKDG